MLSRYSFAGIGDPFVFFCLLDQGNMETGGERHTRRDREMDYESPPGAMTESNRQAAAVGESWPFST